MLDMEPSARRSGRGRRRFRRNSTQLYEEQSPRSTPEVTVASCKTQPLRQDGQQRPKKTPEATAASSKPLASRQDIHRWEVDTSETNNNKLHRSRFAHKKSTTKESTKYVPDRPSHTEEQRVLEPERPASGSGTVTPGPGTSGCIATFISTPPVYVKKVKNHQAMPHTTADSNNSNCLSERGTTIRCFVPTRTPEEVFASFHKPTFPSQRSFKTVLPYNSVRLPSTQDEPPQTQEEGNVPDRPPSPVSPFSAGAAYKVSVAHIIDSQTLYVHDQTHRQLLKDLETEFARHSMAKPEPHEVTEGAELVVADSGPISRHSATNSATLRRCRVTRVIGARARYTMKYTVYCYDYGLTLSVTCAMLRIPKKMDSWVPPLGARCSLYNFTPKDGVFNHITKLVRDIVDIREVLIKVHDVIKIGSIEEYKVEMMTLDRGVSIAHALVFHELGYLVDATMPYPSMLPLQPRPTLDLTLPQYAVGTAIDVVVTHTIADNIYIRKLENEKVYQKLCRDLELEYVQAPIVYLPVIGELLVYEMGSGTEVRYLRALVVEVEGRSRARVVLPDCGRRLSADVARLRHIGDRFARLPPTAMRCHLEGLDKKKYLWKLDQLAELNNSTLRVVVKGQTSDELIVEMMVIRGHRVISVNDAIINNTFRQIVRNIEPSELSEDSAQSEANTSETVASEPTVHLSPTTSKNLLKKNKNDQSQNANLQPEAPKRPSTNSITDDRIDVQVLCSASPDAIYVKFHHQIPFYNELRNNLYVAYKDTRKLSDILEEEEYWGVGDRCCVFDGERSEWKRGVVVETGESWARVLYVDYAACGTTDKSRLKPLKPVFQNIEDAVVMCRLYGLQRSARAWPSVTNEYLAYVLKEAEKCSIKPMGTVLDGSLPVELWVQQEVSGGALEAYVYNWRSVNADLVDQGLALRDNDKPDSELGPCLPADWRSHRTTQQYLSMCSDVSYPPPPRAPLHRAPPEPLQDPPSDLDTSEHEDQESDKEWLPPRPFDSRTFKATITHVNRRGRIYLHPCSQEATVMLVEKRLALLSVKQVGRARCWQAGQAGRACTALCPVRGNYCRAQLLAVSEKHQLCSVFFIDYGNTEQVAFDHVHRAVEMEWIPRVANKCVLAGVTMFRRDDGNLLDASVEFLRNILVDAQCVVQISGPVVDTSTPVLLWLEGFLVNELVVRKRLAAYTELEITAPAPQLSCSE